MRIAHLADVHLGYNYLNLTTAEGQNQREADVERAALAAAQYVCEQVDLAVIAGDVLDSTRISTRGFAGALKFCRVFKQAGVPVVIMPGNHDQAEGEKTFPMLELLAEEGIDVYLGQTTLDFPEARLHLVPFRALSRSLRGKDLDEFDFAKDKANVLVSHGAVDAPGIFEESVMIPKLWIEDPRFALVMLGHIHQHRQINERTFYSGAVEHLGFGEIKEKPGFWIHELNETGLVESTSVLIKDLGVKGVPRPMVELKVECGNRPIETVEREALELIRSAPAGALAKVKLVNVSAVFQQSRMRLDWENEFRARGGLNLEVEAQTRAIGEYFDPEFPIVPTNVADAFQEFLAEQEFDSDTERSALESLSDEIMAVAHEKLVREGDK